MPSPYDSQAYHGAQAQHVGQEMRILTANLERLDCEARELTLGYTLESCGSYSEVLLMG